MENEPQAFGVNKQVILAVTTAASFLTPFMGSSINIALPSLGHEFGMSAVLLGWVAYAFILAAAAVLVPVGKIADIWGRKRIFSIGFIIYTVSSFLCAVAGSPYSLISYRLLQGIAGAMIFGPSIAILTAAFPAGERGAALGINVASVYIGLSAGPFIGGFLTEHFGWRSIFMINVPFGLIVLILILWKIKEEWVETKDERFDAPGGFLYVLALSSMMYGISSLTRPLGVWLVMGGIVLIIIFVFRERNVTNPVFDITRFRHNAAFVFSNLAALINYSATFAVSFLLSLYLQYIKGFNPVYTGAILVAQPVIQAVFSPFAGKLSDRIEPRVVASIGMGITSFGLGLLITIGKQTSVSFIIGVLFLLGLGFALFSSPNTNAIMSSVEQRFYGVASGTLATMRLTGQMLSMGIVMLIMSVKIGDAPMTPEQYPSFMGSLHISLIILCLICFLGIFSSLARGKIH
ncbi:MAG TPA: MFS transporter [Syntrophales bacterium]|nr:MFS transporter [Syntrophales bacterium]